MFNDSPEPITVNISGNICGNWTFLKISFLVTLNTLQVSISSLSIVLNADVTPLNTVGKTTSIVTITGAIWEFVHITSNNTTAIVGNALHNAIIGWTIFIAFLFCLHVRASKKVMINEQKKATIARNSVPKKAK